MPKLSSQAKSWVAEAIGTFALVFVGTGAIVVDASTGGGALGHVGVALAFGLVIMTMIYGSAELQQAWGVINSTYAREFWGLSFVLGVLIPLVLVFGPMLTPTMQFAASPKVVTLAAVLGAVGAYSLRKVLLYAGQIPQIYY